MYAENIIGNNFLQCKMYTIDISIDFLVNTTINLECFHNSQIILQKSKLTLIDFAS